jgi:hypothetical protein
MHASTPRSSLLAWLLAAAVPAQDWNDDQLLAACSGFQADTLGARLEQVGKLLADRQKMFSALVARIHGDHREYLLKVDRLFDELADERWQVREDAERVLVEIGGRARSLLLQRKEKATVLEQQIRCARVLDSLDAKGLEQENRELRLLRGLIATSLYLDADARLQRALRSALGHTDAAIVETAVRALGRIGTDDDVDAVRQQLAWKGGMHRLCSIAAIGRMPGERSIAVARELLRDPATTRTEQAALLRALHQRTDAPAKALVQELASHADPLLAALARLRATPSNTPAPARITLPDKDRTALAVGFGGILGDSTLLHGAFPGLAVAELGFGDCDAIEFPAHNPDPTAEPRIFLNQGSLIAGEILALDGQNVRLRSPLLGEITVPRKDVQGIALDPALDRLVGASTDHDRVRLRTGEFVDGRVAELAASGLRMQLADGTPRQLPLAEVAGLLLQRPRQVDPDPTIFTRIDLVTGERWIGFLADSSPAALAMHLPQVGSAVVPIDRVARIEVGVGGGAMWGFTLIVDFSDNRVIEVDDQGREVFVLEDLLGPWDAECLDNGNLLITEYSVGRVREVTRKGDTVWSFEELRSPYDADRLPNGNTLIADTFGGRVIEVDPKGTIVWTFDKDIRPFDVERLANGNTLIANNLRDCVIEVSPTGEVVWEVRNLPGIYDADRLPNGNTLVTLRNKSVVQELDREGKVVWELTGLSSPSDADRLPNGHTLVAENNRVREFDRRGNEVWRKDKLTWAVEANRY